MRDDGIVKVLDFGLAKFVETTPSVTGSGTMSPTLSLQATKAGVILGTAAYMPPEQARGKTVDKRARHLVVRLCGVRAPHGEARIRWR